MSRIESMALQATFMFMQETVFVFCEFRWIGHGGRTRRRRTRTSRRVSLITILVRIDTARWVIWAFVSLETVINGIREALLFSLV